MAAQRPGRALALLAWTLAVGVASMRTPPCVLEVTDVSVEYALASGANSGSSVAVFLDRVDPRLSWRLAAVNATPASPSALRQTSYRVVAASSVAKLAAGEFDRWDSGVVVSNATLNVHWGGVPLTAHTDVFFRVLVADGLGQACAPSPVGSFTVAPVTPADWVGAQWVTRSNDPPADDCALYAPDPHPLLRRHFTLDLGQASVQSARLFVSGLGWGVTYVDGTRVGDAILDPAWTVYSKRVLFSAYDVTSLLLPSQTQHSVAVELGRGWRDPLPMRLFGAFDLRDALDVGPPQLLLLLRIALSNGTIVNIVSDASWRVGGGALLLNNVYLGEVRDLRRDALPTVAGWTTPAFNDSQPGWANVVVSNWTVGPVALQTTPPVRVTETIPTQTVTQTAPGVFTLDFGQNFAGWVSVRGVVGAPLGTVVNLTFAELLLANGTINPITNLAGAIGRWSGGDWGACARVPAIEQDTIVFAGSTAPEGESYTPTFTWHAFRYVQVDGWPVAALGPPTPAHFVALRTHSDVPRIGNFSSSNALFNQIEGLCIQSFTSNWIGVQSDCPGRERFGYGGDLMTSDGATTSNFDLSLFYQKRARDYADAQRPNGGLPETAPFVGIETCDLGGGTGPMQWGSGHAQLVAKLVQLYGNQDLVAESYPTTQRWLQLLNASAVNYILVNGLADWIDPSDWTCDSDAMGLLGTLFFFQQATLGVRMAAWLNETADAQAYTALAQRLQAAFLPRYFQATTGQAGNATQDQQLEVLGLGILPTSASVAAAARVLAADIAQASYHLETGAFGTWIATDQMVSWGLGELLYRALNQVDFPSYGYMLAKGATALWEHWSADTELISQNHAWLGSVSAFFHGHVAGLQPDPEAFGFDRLIIAPQPLGWANRPGAPSFVVGPPLQWASASHTSIRGLTSVAWTVRGTGSARFELSVQFPPNVRATVFVPLWSANDTASVAGCGPQASFLGNQASPFAAAVFAVQYAGACVFSSPWNTTAGVGVV